MQNRPSVVRRVRFVLATAWLVACTGSSESCTAAGSSGAAGTRTPAPAVASAAASAAPVPVLASSNAPKSASVLQHHKNATRDGVYVDPAFTSAGAAKLRMDANFRATIDGPTFTQPLFFEDGPGGKDVVVVATQQNKVYALDAITGSIVWQKQVGPPVAKSSLPCGNIETLGITGTPAIDAASKTLFIDAMTTPDKGATKKHLIFALSLDDGSTRAGWPLDVSATVKANGTPFESASQSERGALLLLGETLYVPYGGHWGDCGNYRGWVVGVPIKNPSSAKAFATAARGGGIWAPSGLASDGTSIFATTGNTIGASSWGGGEAVLRLRPGPIFSGQPQDYFTPSNWKYLDEKDLDLGGAGPVLIDVPGANPSQLIVALGKTGVIHLVNRANLGGVATGDGENGEGVASAKLSNGIIGAAAAYTTSKASYVVFAGFTMCKNGGGGDLAAIKISATTPPQLSHAWCVNQNGPGGPIVTTPDGRSDVIVWGLGAEGGKGLTAFDGDTGRVIHRTGLGDDAMSRISKYNTPIVAKGRIYVAADSSVYAFTTR